MRGWVLSLYPRLIWGVTGRDALVYRKAYREGHLSSRTEHHHPQGAGVDTGRAQHHTASEPRRAQPTPPTAWSRACAALHCGSVGAPHRWEVSTPAHDVTPPQSLTQPPTHSPSHPAT